MINSHRLDLNRDKTVGQAYELITQITTSFIASRPTLAVKPIPVVAAPVHALGKLSWPHAPLHELSARGTYFLTAGTYGKQHYFRGADRLAVLHRGLLKVALDFGWQLEAWAVFSNHSNFVAHSPPPDGTAESLPRMLGLLHEKTAKWINRIDCAPGRQVWHNFW